MVKTYGGVTALSRARITLRAGEIHGLVGENGAGKSTLVKILCGVLHPDAGTIRIDQAEVSFGNPRDAAAAGVAFVAQELSLFPELSVRENLFPLTPLRRLGLIHRRALDAQAIPVLERLALDVEMHTPVGDLSLADQQLLEIGRALLARPRILILDEPTSAQSKQAVARLETVLRAVAREGIAILYISHFLEEVMRIADRITVMRDSRTVLDDAAAQGVDLDQLVEAMIGGALGRPTAGRPRPPEPMEDRDVRRLRLIDVEVPDRLHGVTLHVSPGEVVGVAGLQGAGHGEVLRVVCGQVRPSAGQVLLPGGVRPTSLRHAFAHGVGLVPSDRKAVGLMLDKRVWENVVAAQWLGLGRGGAWLRRRRQQQRSEAMLRRLRLRGDVDTTVSQLSGGNQQKVVFAKWLETEPSVMVLDDPTRGVDIGARAEMHEVIRGLAAQGKAVLIASTDLAELVELCDRIAVFQRGRQVSELSGVELDQKTLSTAMNAGFAAEVEAR
jgi:ABC-type sugar transport system ATPase subunit